MYVTVLGFYVSEYLVPWASEGHKFDHVPLADYVLNTGCFETKGMVFHVSVVSIPLFGIVYSYGCLTQNSNGAISKYRSKY